MIRFEKGHKLDDRSYARQDGTRSYFFTLNEMENLFVKPRALIDSSHVTGSHISEDVSSSSESCLFRTAVNEYVFRETINVKEGLRVPRVFVQSKFIRSEFRT